MDKFRNKYRIPSARAQWWNYKNAAAYFITINTIHRQHFFGEIMNTQMHLNEIGTIVEQEWLRSAELRPDMNLTMDEFVVMPDHFHGIVVIGGKDAMHGVFTGTGTWTGSGTRTGTGVFGPQSKNLASIVRGFKSSVTIRARKINAAFGWQSRFHDRIIRDDAEYERIVQYIMDNPRNWNG